MTVHLFLIHVQLIVSHKHTAPFPAFSLSTPPLPLPPSFGTEQPQGVWRKLFLGIEAGHCLLLWPDPSWSISFTQKAAEEEIQSIGWMRKRLWLAFITFISEYIQCVNFNSCKTTLNIYVYLTTWNCWSIYLSPGVCDY